MESRSGRPSVRITRRQLFVAGIGTLGAMAFGLRRGGDAFDGRQARIQRSDILHRTGDRSCQCPICTPGKTDVGLA